MSSNLRSTIYIILIVAAIIGSAFVWYGFFTSRPVEPVTAVSTIKNGVSAVSPSLLVLLESVQGLSFDLSIIDNPLYKSLEDFTPRITAPEIIGRPNPFAPFER